MAALPHRHRSGSGGAVAADFFKKSSGAVAARWPLLHRAAVAARWPLLHRAAVAGRQRLINFFHHSGAVQQRSNFTKL